MPSRVRICGEILRKSLSYGKGRKTKQNTNEKTDCGDLFSLYRSLAGPFQEFENRSRRKRELERKLEQGTKNAKEPVSFNYKRTLRAVFSDTLRWAIPFLIIFWIIMNVVQINGEKLLPVLSFFFHLCSYAT